ncbi:hypothetical protein [Kitasatospora purpeofusca]|uniref:RapZ C-terminal domain-containing protein n=1 Tax=Kitasatospora purpeofusca TaxID=67352 RepID=UPI0036D37DC9
MSTTTWDDHLAATPFEVEVTTYGTLHQDPPPGDAITVDLTTALRNPPEDPQVREQMIRSTGLDQHVLDYVLDTPGAREIADRTARRALAQYVALPGEPIRIHLYCRGGRHRSVAVGRETGRLLQDLGAHVTLTHRHVGRDVVEPPLPGTADPTDPAEMAHMLNELRYRINRSGSLMRTGYVTEAIGHTRVCWHDPRTRPSPGEQDH